MALLAGTTGVLGLAGCQSGGPDQRGRPVEAATSAREASAFRAGRAWADLLALVQIGPRSAGSPGAAAARGHISQQLTQAGAGVREIESSAALAAVEDPSLTSTHPLSHVIGELPGASSDVILLAAHYDSYAPVLSAAEGGGKREGDYLDANGSASGPALLLELARALAESPPADRAYTVWFLFIEGDAGDTPLPPYAGSASLASQLAGDGSLDRVRLAVFLDQVGDAELEVTRDLRSLRAARELFWKTAAELGYQRAFPASARFGAPAGSHRAFVARGLRQVVAIGDDRYGGGEAPGLYWHSIDDTPERCSQQSLAVVGEVTLETLARMARRLARIDRFVRPPRSAASEGSGETGSMLESGK